MKGWFNKIGWRQRYIVWTNWEYWSANWFYLPLGPWFVYLSLRNGHPCFFTAANPGIFTGGLGFESKYDTLQLIPEAYRPKSIRVDFSGNEREIMAALAAADIDFPLVAKPDLGFRGFLVKKIEDKEALFDYLRSYPVGVILQEYLRARQEFGVLYYRMPGESRGQVTSLTIKELLTVKGDGERTLRDLILANSRALLQMEVLEKNYAADMGEVPASGEKFSLGIVGNHCRGARFINGNEWIDAQLTEVFDQITSQMEGFYYGRFDIKCDDIEKLRKGEGIHIIEVNGVCSEPVHIYDPARISYFEAVRQLGRHWKIVADISRINRRRGVAYMSARQMIRVLRSTRRYFRDLAARG